jgi:AraC-like DNA-binding protein
MSESEQPFRRITQTPRLLEHVFDAFPDVLFFIKDTAGRYLWANRVLVERSGVKQRTQIIGKKADHLFPASGPSTLAQDLLVIQRRRPIQDALRLYSVSRGVRYWCLSSKFPLYDGAKNVVGLFGFSRDLPHPNERHRSYYRLAKFLRFIERRFAEGVAIAEAAKAASLSMDTLARLVHEVYHLTPRQLLVKKRIDHACQLLEDTRLSIAQISTACGYADQSAFTRKFKAVTHVTPGQYRAVHKAGDGSITAAPHPHRPAPRRTSPDARRE